MALEWKGIFPAVTTKFNADESLDLKTFKANIQAQLDAGVHGIVLGGTLGEASSLEADEKMTLLKETLNIVNGRVPVVLNIAEQSTKAALRYVAEAEDNGANGFMLLPPMRYAADSRETLTYFKAIVKSTKLPFMIYNNPVDYKILVTLDMFEELAAYDNVQSVKESTREIQNVTRMINRFGNRFKILTGVDTLALESLMMGAVGWVAGLVCAFPKETVAIYNLVQDHKYEEALAIYRWFLPLLELDVSTKLVQNIKMAEAATGLGTEHVRAPRLPLAGDERKRVESIISAALKQRPRL